MDLKQQIIHAVEKSPYDPLPLRDLFDLCRVENDHETNKIVRKHSTERIRTGACDTRFYELYRKSLLFDATEDFDAFLQYIEIDRNPVSRFYLPRRRYLLPMVRGYQMVHDGKLDVYTVSQPKRTGKSQTEILFALMQAGLKQDRSILMEGIGDDLCDSFYKGFLEYVDDVDQYLLRDIFPGLNVASRNAALKTVNFERSKRFPTLMCRSITASQVGLSEANNLLILDDCVEGYEEAQSLERLDKKWKVISGDVMGRRIEGTPIIMTGTRYSLYDPIGKMQEHAKRSNLRVHSIEIPALDPVTDESNYEYTDLREDRKIFTTAYFREQRLLLSAEQFNSEFQQQPIEKGAILFTNDKINRFFELPPDKDPDSIIAVCDTAEKGTDSVALPVAYIYGDDVFIPDLVFDSSSPDVTKPECANILVRHNVSRATFESNNAGEYYARDVSNLIKEKKGKTSIRTKRTISNKISRIVTESDMIMKHFYFLDESKYAPNSQYAQFMRELMSFSRDGKNPHDDAPDSLSLLSIEIRNLTTPKYRILERPF